MGKSRLEITLKRDSHDALICVQLALLGSLRTVAQLLQKDNQVIVAGESSEHNDLVTKVGPFLHINPF
jgi:hypothetical protein